MSRDESRPFDYETSPTADPDAPPIVDGLQLERHNDFQRREWRILRLGWFCWSAIVLAALAGLLGDGPLSSTTAASEDLSLVVHYDRFVHRHDPCMLKLSITPPAGTQDELRLSVDRDYLSNLEIRAIVPEPERTVFGEDKVTMVFPMDGSPSLMSVVIHYSPEPTGKLNGVIRLEGATPVRFWQFVYP